MKLNFIWRFVNNSVYITRDLSNGPLELIYRSILEKNLLFQNAHSPVFDPAKTPASLEDYWSGSTLFPNPDIICQVIIMGVKCSLDI